MSHQSIKINKIENYGNSRYVFLGMYAFKGLIAAYLFKYIAGNGQQLQHYLGNIFTNKRLVDIYEDLKIGSAASYGENFNIEGHKHIFTLAYLGFIYENATEWYIERTIYNYFIFETDHLLPKLINTNIFEKLNHKAKMVLNQKIHIKHIENKIDGIYLHSIKIIDNNGNVLAFHESKSERYARKAASKKALKNILDQELLFLGEDRITKLKELDELKIQEKIKAKKLENELYLKKKTEEIKKKKSIRERKKALAKYKDELRKKSKKNQKEREYGKNQMSKSEIKKILSSGAVMSSSKRRLLEDKLK